MYARARNYSKTLRETTNEWLRAIDIVIDIQILTGFCIVGVLHEPVDVVFVVYCYWPTGARVSVLIVLR